MKLSPRSKSYMIPEYSLTGDLLSFLTCNLQYRYQNRGTLPPSMPIQLWFGEFIHGVMEETYLKWRNNKDMGNDKSFPWNWKEDIRPVEEMIDLRLRARGLYPPLDFFCKYHKDDDNKINNALGSCEDENHPHKLLYSARAESSINVWGPDLFPLIDSAEVLIKGKRPMPNFEKNTSRSNYYGINGVIDVISSLKLDENNENENLINKIKDKNDNKNKNNDNKNKDNKNKDNNKNDDKNNKNNKNSIINYLMKNEKFSEKVKSLDSDEYEIIIDYKGMKRPSLGSHNWKYHQWQLLTYAWLRQKQNDSKPIIAGIIFYLNELVPSTEDLIAIKQDIIAGDNDVKINPSEESKIKEWDEKKVNYIKLSDNFKKDRSIRTIVIEEETISTALQNFDNVVSDIETSIINETNGIPIKKAWEAKGDKRTCDACDFKTFCNKTDLNELKIP